MEQVSDLSLFNELFTIYKGRFVRFAQTFTRDATIAEDIVIDSLIYYWEHRTELNKESNIPAYVLTVIKHKCLNYLQHKTVIKEVSEQLYEHAQWELNTRIATLEACEPYEIFAAEAQKIVNDTLDLLPERTREIFIMSRIQNLPHKEIAEKLNISYKSVEFQYPDGHPKKEGHSRMVRQKRDGAGPFPRPGRGTEDTERETGCHAGGQGTAD